MTGAGSQESELSLEWDERYRLENVQITNSTNQIQYTYNVLGRRISRIENGTANYFVYDDNHVVADLNPDKYLLRTYGYGLGIDNIQPMTTYSGNELTSDLGFPTSAGGTRYTFQGHEIDGDTGLTYFRARWYDPETGYWLSKDPETESREAAFLRGNDQREWQMLMLHKKWPLRFFWKYQKHFRLRLRSSRQPIALLADSELISG